MTEAPPRRVSIANIRVPKKPSAAVVAPAQRSAAHIKVPGKQPPAVKPPSPAAALFRRLERLRDGSGTNRNDQVITLISACLTEGLNTGRQIVGVITRLGFNNKHVAMTLRHGTGLDSQGYRWRRGDDGTYSLLK